MIRHECRDEVIAVVVAGLQPQLERDPGAVAGIAQKFGSELIGEKLIALPLIDENPGNAGACVDQGDGIVAIPGGAIVAQIACQRLFSPRHSRRRNDRREGTDCLVSVRKRQPDRQRAVPAHRMAHDRLTGHVCGELLTDQCRQLIRHIGPHAIVRRIGRLRRVDVEAGAQAEIIGGRRIVRHALAARTGIGGDEDQAQLRTGAAILPLLRHVRVGAGQARQVPDDRQPGAGRMIRHENGKGHRRAGRPAVVPIDPLHAAMRPVGGKRLQPHQ